MRRARVADVVDRIRSLALVALIAVLAPLASGAQQPPYKDSQVPVQDRVADLLGRMTLEEKVAQLLSVGLAQTESFDSELRFDPAQARARYPNRLGPLARPSDTPGAGSPRTADGRPPP